MRRRRTRVRGRRWRRGSGGGRSGRERAARILSLSLSPAQSVRATDWYHYARHTLTLLIQARPRVDILQTLHPPQRAPRVTFLTFPFHAVDLALVVLPECLRSS